MRKNKRAIGALVPFVITLVVIGFIVAIGLSLLEQVGDMEAGGWNGTHCAGGNSFACNASHTLEEETSGIADWYGIIVLAIIALVVLTIVMVIRARAEQG